MIVVSRFCLALFLHAVLITSLSAQLHDFQWLFGTYRAVDNTEEVYNIQFDFHDRPVSINEVEDTDMIFYFTGTRVADSLGNLLFYGNGCEIKNRYGERMANGGGLNPGIIADFYCDPEDGWNTYPGATQSILSLPQPGHDSIWYVFHQTMEIDPFIFAEHSMYSLVNTSANDEAGELMMKNVILDSLPAIGQLSACLSDDLEAWYIPISKRGGGDVNTYRLDSSGLELHHQQMVGDPWDPNDAGAFMARFSPDGSLFVRYSARVGLQVFDFDRSTGEFSNFRSLPRLVPTDSIGTGGVEFSPSGRFLYLTSWWYIDQIDLWAPSLAEGLTRVAIKEPEETLFPAAFMHPQLGPDCRLYIFCGSCDWVHLIHRPDELGTDCMFEYKAIQTPTSYFRGTPIFPKYRMRALGDTSSICDHVTASVISSTTELVEAEGAELLLYPNPAGEAVRLLWPESPGSVVWRIYDLQGRQLLTGRVDQQAGQEALEIDLQRLTTGAYLLQLWNDQGQQWTRKLMVE